ncbi:hypothetical protein [Bacillus sp. FJAT-47783]|uniref:hypothetical protein n=1 Tax=Bacillus sp. FJAT-47783 TaxID=2922712 RepID=UPI001FAB65C3|nr:hypothetical protein [Bacillus sp. FJAT-47783]
MGLYDDEFCHNIVYGTWDLGVIHHLRDALHEIKKNFEEMDLENASVEQEMEEIIDQMVTELSELIETIQSVHFS